MVRNYGRVPPTIAASNKPAISAATGLGTGGGASYQTPDDGGFGEVFVFVGVGASPNWSVSLTYPSAPPTVFIAASDEMGTLSQSTVGNVLTISGTGASVIPGKRYKLWVEWFTSF